MQINIDDVNKRLRAKGKTSEQIFNVAADQLRTLIGSLTKEVETMRATVKEMREENKKLAASLPKAGKGKIYPLGKEVSLVVPREKK